MSESKTSHAAAAPLRERSLIILETNIDDMSPELFPPVLRLLLEAGALDAWLVPAVMKHGRPAQVLSALCDPELKEQLLDIIFRETTSLGAREIPCVRHELVREVVPVETPYGTIGMKIGSTGGGEPRNAAPELRDCERAAREHGVPVKTVFAVANAAWWSGRK